MSRCEKKKINDGCDSGGCRDRYSGRDITGCGFYSGNKQTRITLCTLWMMWTSYAWRQTRWGQICCVCINLRYDFMYLCIYAFFSSSIESESLWYNENKTLWGDVAEPLETLNHRYIPIFWLNQIEILQVKGHKGNQNPTPPSIDAPDPNLHGTS